MNVTFDCPRCEQSARVEVAQTDRQLGCPACAAEIQFPDGAWQGGKVERCLVCPSSDLFLRKDFPQKVGVAIVVFGIVTSTIAYYFERIYLTFGLLFLSAAIDLLLYKLVGMALVCYRCGAHYRSLAGLDGHEPFNLETHERYRQRAARLAMASREKSATAASHTDSAPR